MVMRRGRGPRLLVLVVALAAWGCRPLAGAIRAQEKSEPCRADSIASGVADADLYCIELLPARDIVASGTARFLPPASPFGIAVSPAGETLHDVLF